MSNVADFNGMILYKYWYKYKYSVVDVLVYVYRYVWFYESVGISTYIAIMLQLLWVQQLLVCYWFEYGMIPCYKNLSNTNFVMLLFNCVDTYLIQNPRKAIAIFALQTLYDNNLLCIKALVVT